MKRFLAAVLFLAICMTFVACGEASTEGTSDDGKDSGTSAGSTEDGKQQDGTDSAEGDKGTDTEKKEIDFSAIMSGNGATDVVYAQQDEAFKQAFVEAASKAGLQVTFSEDGKTTVKNADGAVMVQLSDGKWQAGEAKNDFWQKSEFTDILPKPTFELISNDPFEGERVDGKVRVGISILGTCTKVQAQQYVQQLKNAGFTVGASEKEVFAYEFIAENEAGYLVSVSYISPQISISIDRNK